MCKIEVGAVWHDLKNWKEEKVALDWNEEGLELLNCEKKQKLRRADVVEEWDNSWSLKLWETLHLLLAWNCCSESVTVWPPPSLQVIAVVMDVFTDVDLMCDLMEASNKRRVPVYILLDERSLCSFTDMCSALDIQNSHLSVSTLALLPDRKMRQCCRSPLDFSAPSLLEKQFSISPTEAAFQLQLFVRNLTEKLQLK